MDHVSSVRARIADIQGRFGAGHPAMPAPPVNFARELQSVVATTPGEPPHAGAAKYDALIRAAAQRHGVDPALVRAVARAESGFNPMAVSRAGAQGLMQLMPSTGRALGVSDPFDPEQNIDGGARYLRSMLDRFGDPTLAIAAYNAGPGAVSRYGGVPPYAETQAYVARVQGYMAEQP